ncbi:MAG: PmbA protein [Thermoproteota archaeon]|jgi:PmbA protein
MIKQEVKNLMKKSIDYALEKGADGCDIILNQSESLSISSQQSKIDKYSLSNTEKFGIRVSGKQRIGIAYSERMSEEALFKTIDMAIENSKSADINEYEKFEQSPVDIIEEGNPKLLVSDNTSMEEKIDLSLKLESEILRREPRAESAPYNGVSDSSYSSYYMNSPGGFCFQEGRSVSCYTSALLKEGSDNSTHYHSAVARSFDSLNWKSCIDESLFHSTRWLKGKSISTGSYDVIFKTSALASILGCFGRIFSAKAAMDKMNPFLDKLGKQVAHKELNIKDMPNYEKSFSYSSWDDEGVAQKDLQLISNGELLNFYHNTATANYYGTQTTGHAARSAGSPLGVSGTTKVISAGSMDMSKIQSGSYLEVHEMDGLHSGVNGMSGDFSFAARGYLMKDGEITQAVKGITVAGNFFEMLLELEGIGDTVLSNDSKTFFSPLLRFKNIKISS